mgnify:CR=1 FL=1
MSKDSVSDWDTTAANNTDIGGIPFGENLTYPRMVNNAMREMMAQIAAGPNQVFVGDSGSGGVKGLVPAPAAGDAAANKFLKADGSWASLSVGDLEITVSLLALQVADNSNAALFLGAAGNRVADSFDTLTYVDVAGSTNLDTSVAGVLKPSRAAGTITYNGGNPPAATPVNGWNGVTFIQLVATLTNGATYASLGAFLTNSATVQIKIIKRNSAGNFDVVADTGAVTHPGGGWADFSISPFTVPGTGAYYVGTYFQTDSTTAFDTGVSRIRYSGNPTGTGNSGTEASGSSPAARATTLGAIQNLTVRSSAFVAAVAPTKMKALIRVKEVDAGVAGTDYTLECSRDGGTTWATMALTELFTSPSPTASIRVVDAAETDVSGQPSGTSPRWRFKTLNTKAIELHDAYLYWS